MKFITAFSVLIIVSLSGCSGLSNKKDANNDSSRKYRETIEARYLSNSDCRFNSESLKKVEFEGDVSAGRTSIKYQNGLSSQAEYIAQKLDDIFDYVENETGIEFAVNPQIYLLRVQDFPENFNFHFKAEEPNIFPMPVFAEIEREDPNLIMKDNHFLPFMITHEITEASLIYPDGKGVVKNDSARFQVLFLVIGSKKYTRWFRDGFSNYAGYVAMDYLRSDSSEDISEIWNTAYVTSTPFSSLRDIDVKLFKWTQYLNLKLSGDYYNAALGLFLLLEDKFGREAIRDIITELDNYKSLEGSDLIKLINSKLDTDIRKLIKDFKFMTIGSRTYPLTRAACLNKGLEFEQGILVKEVEPGTLEEAIGLDANDVIIAVNDQEIAARLHLELELFKAMKQPEATLKIWRQGQGYKEIQFSTDHVTEKPLKRKPKKIKEAKMIKNVAIIFRFRKSKQSKEK